MSSLDKTALIFEGGGMRASGTSPVVVKLLQEGVVFPHVSGISAGSSNTINYLGGDIERTKQCWVDFLADPYQTLTTTINQLRDRVYTQLDN